MMVKEEVEGSILHPHIFWQKKSGPKFGPEYRKWAGPNKESGSARHDTTWAGPMGRAGPTLSKMGRHEHGTN